MFSERLKLARKREGWSLRGLADQMGGAVSAQAIGKYERGEMMPSSTVAIALADALGVSMSYLLSPSDLSLQCVEFRKHASTKAKERAMVESAVVDQIDRYLEVEGLLGIDASQWDVPNCAPCQVTAVEDADQAAGAIRAAWNLGGDPIPNMTELLEMRGIKVLQLDCPPSVDGMTCSVHRSNGQEVPVVVCTTNKSIERQRFTLAHELGHLVLEVADEVDEEKTCHRFAGAFLAPKKELSWEIGLGRQRFGYRELIDVKRIFGISAAALVYRLRDLEIINDSAVTRVFKGIGRTWRKDEPCPLERGESTMRFQRLCFRALAEDTISESKAAELLNLSVGEIDQMMSGPLDS